MRLRQALGVRQQVLEKELRVASACLENGFGGGWVRELPLYLS